MPVSMPGGPADKYGNRFEGRWTIHCLIELLRGRVEAIELEPPGESGVGVEFVVLRGGHQEHHQVKSGRSHGQWTIQRLSREGVLENFRTKLTSDLDCTYVLVTESPADELHLLGARAREASSVEDFEARLSDELTGAWQRLKTAWPELTAQESLSLLTRIQDFQWSEGALRTLLTTEVESLMQGSPDTSASVLAQFALDRLSGRIIATDVWKHLQTVGVRPTNWAEDNSVAQALHQATERYLRPHREEAILGSPIPRTETGEVVNLLLDKKPSVVLLTGKGGIGKSGVTAQVVEALTNDGYPALPLRADLLEPTQLPRAVGDQIGLPGSPPAVLGALSAGRRSVLLLDQLDSVSLTSGRHPEFWQCLRELIEEARYQPEMSVVIACRQFDLHNDDRLRALSEQFGGPAKVVEIGSLSTETVDGVVANLGVPVDTLRPSQRELLSVPLHLRLLTLVAAESGEQGLDFETANDLFDRFWEHKRQRVTQRMAPSVGRWAQLLEGICERMSREESLSIPRAALGEFADEIPILISEHVLVENAGRIAFFHQGFFDYAFARAFGARDEDLMDYLLQRDQGLFRRAQVRQILLYERDNDKPRYLRDLRSVLTDARIRFHLKRTALDYLSSIAAPWREEWTILKGAIETDNDLKQHAFNLIAASPAWFDLVANEGVIDEWLTGEGERVAEAVTILGRIQRERPARVAKMLTSFIGKSDDWNTRLTWVAQWADLSDRAAFDFFLRLLESGVLDDARGPIAVNSDFWSLIYPLHKQRASWATELIGAYLERRLTIAKESGIANPFDSSNGTIPDTQHTELVLQTAKHASEDFVRSVLPFMAEVCDRTVDKEKPPLRRDPVWSFRYPGETYSLSSALLGAMEQALRGLAKSDGNTFRKIVDEYGQHGSDTLDFLLARGFLGGPAELADAAIDFLIAVPDRLHLGYASEMSWASRELLAWALQSCLVAQRHNVQSVLLDYYPSWELSARGHRRRGECQYVLLSGVPENLLTEEAKKRLRELQRKFKVPPEPPEAPEVFAVGSPIAQESTELMTDEQWVKAMSKYSSDWGDSRGPEGGGAIQLSRALQASVPKDPERFVQLIEVAPDQINPHYFSAVVEALGDPVPAADMSLLVRACERCDRLPGRPCGMAIVRAVERRARESISDALVRMVAWYAVNDPDPEKETWEQHSSTGDPFYGGSIHSAGINSVRGVGGEAIAAILFSENDHYDILHPALEKLVEDPHVSVRSCVAKCLIALLRHHRDAALRLFLRLVDTREELLGTPYIERFLYYTLQTNYDRLRPVVAAMIQSETADVATAGARQTCFASLEIEEARDLRARCMSGREALRSGAAEIFAANLRGTGHREICEESLRQLFNDPDSNVRKKAARCFDRLKGSELEDFALLANDFIGSKAFEQSNDSLLRALENCEVALSEVTCLFAERFVEVAGAVSGDIRTAAAGDSADVSQLIVRVYSQATDVATRERALDVIDRMSALRSYGLEGALEAFER
jgi:hypothetical protein